MIVQCPDCTTRFELDSSLVPPRKIRVRCARCRYVFPIDGMEAQVDAPAQTAPARDSVVEEMPPEVASVPETAPQQQAPIPPAEPMEGLEPTRIEDAPAMPEGFDLEIERPQLEQNPVNAGPQAAPASQEPAGATATMAPEPDPVEVTPAESMDPGERKARRLARALVSDILVYNRDKRDAALAQGKLVQALGQEIKKSWELYKERVTPEVASSTNYFKEALNEILAEGQKIF